MSNPTNKKLAGLERVTEKEKEEKVRKQGYTIPTIEDVNFALRFETLTCQSLARSQATILTLEGYASTKTVYCFPSIHTLHNQVHIVVSGAMGDALSASNDPIFPLHHSFVIAIASLTRTLRFFRPTMHPSDTTKMRLLYHFILCILINTCLRSLSSSVMITTMSTRMVSIHDVSDLPKLFPLTWIRLLVTSNSLSKKSLQKLTRPNFPLISKVAYYNVVLLDCLYSAFSLKIRLVLIPATPIANHKVI